MAYAITLKEKMLPSNPDTYMIVRDGNTYIPCDLLNADCAQFLADWQAGVPVTNADGSLAPYSDAAATALGLALPSN